MNDEQINIIIEMREALDMLAGPNTLDMFDAEDSWEACGERATELVWEQSPDETKELLFRIMEQVENLTFLLDKIEGADSFGEDWKPGPVYTLDEIPGPFRSEDC